MYRTKINAEKHVFLILATEIQVSMTRKFINFHSPYLFSKRQNYTYDTLENDQKNAFFCMYGMKLKEKVIL